MHGRGAYEFGEDRGREERRLAAVERAFDPASRWALLEAGVRDGWSCWEVGAGRGSIANWLARTVGLSGHVLATDLDRTWFTAEEANLSFQQHDVAADPLPAERFDLIHGRFLLEHLPDPQQVIGRLHEALRPGGVVVFEDAAGLQLDIAPPVPTFDELLCAWEKAGRAVGWNATYGTGLAPALTAAGLGEVRGHLYRQIAPGGEDWTHLRQGLERLGEQLINEGIAQLEIQRAISCLADSEKLITGPPVVIAWGWR